MKECRKCHMLKESHEFYSHNATRDRLNSFCKECDGNRKKTAPKKSAIADMIEAHPYLNKWRKRLNDLCINDAYVLPSMAVLRLPDVLTSAGVPLQRYAFADIETGNQTGASASLRDMLESLIDVEGNGEVVIDYRHTLSCRRWHIAV